MESSVHCFYRVPLSSLPPPLYGWAISMFSALWTAPPTRGLRWIIMLLFLLLFFCLNLYSALQLFQFCFIWCSWSWPGLIFPRCEHQNLQANGFMYSWFIPWHWQLSTSGYYQPEYSSTNKRYLDRNFLEDAPIPITLIFFIIKHNNKFHWRVRYILVESPIIIFSKSTKLFLIYKCHLRKCLWLMLAGNLLCCQFILLRVYPTWSRKPRLFFKNLFC